MSFPRKQKIHLLVKKVEPIKCKERLEKETDEDKTPKRATHEVPKEKDGIEKLPTVLKCLQLIMYTKNT